MTTSSTSSAVEPQDIRPYGSISVLSSLRGATVEAAFVRAHTRKERRRMCVAVPGRIIEIIDSHDGLIARVDVAGVVREASTALVPDLEVGDYTVVHMGYALERIDPAHAMETLHLLAEAGVVETREGRDG